MVVRERLRTTRACSDASDGRGIEWALLLDAFVSRASEMNYWYEYP